MGTTTRRKFLAGAAALPLAWRACTAQAMQTNATAHWVLLGTDKGKGIYRAAWNAATGELGPTELAAETVRPTYFAMHPAQPVLYVANEKATGVGGISSFRVDAGIGRGPAALTLTPMERLSSHGGGPCYVSVDTSDARVERAYVANYEGGSLAAYAIKSNGALVEGIGSFDCNASLGDCGALGPIASRQGRPHLHCAVVAPGSGHVIACDLGDDTLLVFERAKYGVAQPIRYKTRAGSGPRHVAFHPNGKWVYCIHELDCSVDLWDWSIKGSKGVLKPRAGSIVSTVAKVAAGNTAAEVRVSDDGRFVYANTRGENTLTVYRVDPATGLLTEQQRVNTGGAVTRLFAFDPTRRWLLCCNQGMDDPSAKDGGAKGSVTVFAHDPATGRLQPTPKTFAAESPMCVVWV